jgi:predicted permease
LRNGVSLSQARAELETLTAALANAYPASNVGRKLTLVPEAQTRTGVANTGLALLGIAALVLLVACANVASLLLAHGQSRRKEIATRLALGGSRAILIRQFLAETALLALLATLMALLLGNFALDALPRLLPQTSIPIAIDAHLNLRAFLFALATGVVSLLFFGLLPALQTTNLSPVAVLKQSGIQAEARRTRFRSALTVAQVALSLVMVVCSGLLVRSVLAALALDPGFNAHQNMLIMELVPAFGSKNPQESVAFVREARQRLQALPGVVATTIALHFPFGMSGGGATRKVFFPGTLSETEGVTINSDLIGSEYFSVLGTSILRGRAIDQHDVDMKAHVLVVNQSLAHRFWPKQDAIGNRVRLSSVNGTEYEIIGVVEDGKYNDVREDRTPLIYLPLSDEEDYGELAMAVKTKMDPESLAPLVRQTLRGIKREVPILALVTLREHMREALYEQRVIAGAIGGMGALGVILAAIGIYGLMAFLVRRRTPEIGIRMALGARREGILWLVLRHSLFLTAIGAAIGTAGAIAAAQGLRSLLFGVAPTDAATIATAIVVLAIVAIMAAAVPALKAAKVDPMVALRYE